MKEERLTKKNKWGTIIADCKGCDDKGKCPIKHEKGVGGICDCKIKRRLFELEDDLESGKMIRLPCKVGDTVWGIVTSTNRTSNTIIYKHIQEYQVERIEIDSYNLLYLVITVFTEDGICEGYARPNQVYYTKAEAEAKFKELKGE